MFFGLLSFAAFGVRRARERAAETQCKNNLRQVGLALWHHCDVYSAFPAAHAGGHSWRIRLIPYIWSSPQYIAYDFDQPWDAPNNMVHTRPLPSSKGDMSTPDPLMVFGHPYGRPCDHDDPDITSYVMLVGENVFGHPNKQRQLSDITDGPENTIAVVEVAKSSVHWLSPVDRDFANMSFKVNDGRNSISSHHPTGPAVLFCDGAVFRLNSAIPPETVRGLCTINGSENLSRHSLVEQGLLIP